MTAQTKKYILDVILQELRNEQLGKLTVKRVSKLANMARSTMYFQFSSIDDIYIHLVNRELFNEAFEHEHFMDSIECLLLKFEMNRKIYTNIFYQTKESKRRKFLYERLYDYLINHCQTFEREEFEEFETEMKLLTRYVVFHVELLVRNELNFSNEDFKKQVNNYVSYLKS
ncbi:TetR/AcrR family transcriptional regulator [Lactobacillus sp. YT155]|uniref:TetR/AcrR family transcriptional regulator n=1 Tax=Lactobacillus sp. YT155 TaxID=3060955 RepID=UPI00265FCFE6|nr:TetR/AcrR family transcriptional regulator [Lactobacillus sp. YT155]MDO1605081.1 TetR/AcrR family transcriptional regulator [Lactobacillus sp. YT155]